MGHREEQHVGGAVRVQVVADDGDSLERGIDPGLG
jgi:hypothetical protein